MVKKRTIEELYTEILNKTNGKLILKTKDKYKDNKMDIILECQKCHNTFKSKPYRVLSNGNGCPFCYGNNRMTIKEAQEKLDKVKPGEFKILSRDKNKYKVQAIKCGHIYDGVVFSNLTRSGCRVCKGREFLGSEGIKEEYSRIDNEYEVISNFDRLNDPHILRHKTCNTEFKCYFYNFRDRFQRCPECTENKSLPEKRIEEFLDKNKINYQSQVKYEWLKLNKPLRIDYLINNNIHLEYDGEFHFIKMYNNQDLSLSRNRDLFKNKILLENGMNLIRIPYNYKRHINSIMDLIINKKYKDLSIRYSKIFISIPSENIFYNNEENYFSR